MTAQPNANALIPTTVSTVLPYRRLTAVKAITATVLQNVRRLTATTAGTKRRFRCRPMLTARPTTPTAPPNVPPGAVTQVITNPEIHAYKPAITAVNVRDTPCPVPVNANAAEHLVRPAVPLNINVRPIACLIWL